MSSPVPDDWRPTATLEILRLRGALLGELRRHFAATGALEVETPALVQAPVTDLHLESLEVRRADGVRLGFLHTSPEYAMKRLLAAGAPDLYQIAHVFREGERGGRHNPEFTMVEWYRHGIDHHGLMDEVERLLRTLLAPHRAVGATQRIRYVDAVAQALDVDALAAAPSELVAALGRRNLDVPPTVRADRDALLDLAMSLCVASGFADDRLTFVYDFPASQAALARIRGPVASRFEAFWGPLELANGFHELTDRDEQARRFAGDTAERARRGRPDREMDRRFLDALASGLPDCSGVALGFDRVVMVAARATRIDEVVAFPIERS